MPIGSSLEWKMRSPASSSHATSCILNSDLHCFAPSGDVARPHASQKKMSWLASSMTEFRNVPKIFP